MSWLAWASAAWDHAPVWASGVWGSQTEEGGGGGGDTTPPWGEFKTPVDNQVVYGNVRVSASASDDVGVSSVSFWLNSVYTTSIYVAPYGFTFDANPYGHKVRVSASARFEDAAGNYFSPSEVWITAVQTLSGSVSKNVVSAAAAVDVTFNIAISGSASFVKLSYVTFFGTQGAYFNNSVATSHTTTIRFPDEGEWATQLQWAQSPTAGTAASPSLSVWATASSDPTGGFMTPANGQSVSGSVRLSASATDAAGVSSVTFWLNGALTTTIYAAPYGFNFDSSLYGTGVTISASSLIEDNTRNFGTMAERWLITDLTPGAAIAGGLGGIKFVPLGGVGGTKKAVGAVVPGKSRRTT